MSEEAIEAATTELMGPEIPAAKSTTNPVIKKILFDTIAIEPGQVDQFGRPIQRQGIKRELYVGFASLKKKIADSVEVSTDGGTTFVPVLTLSPEQRQSELKERFTAEPMEFTDDELATAKYYFDQLKEIPSYCDIDTFHELATLLA